jgi:hypothetical protein
MKPGDLVEVLVSAAWLLARVISVDAVAGVMGVYLLAAGSPMGLMLSLGDHEVTWHGVWM